MPEVTNNTTQTQDVVTPNTSTNEEKGGKTFTQDEVNELIAKRVNELNAKNKTATQDAVNKALAEHERLAKLTQEERDKEARSKRELELKAREDNITLRERRIEAQEQLQSANIPIELVDFVIDLDEGKTKANVERLAKVYNQSVEAGVTNKLKGTPPTDFSSNNKDDSKKDIVTAF